MCYYSFFGIIKRAIRDKSSVHNPVDVCDSDQASGGVHGAQEIATWFTSESARVLRVQVQGQNVWRRGHSRRDERLPTRGESYQTFMQRKRRRGC